MANNYCTLFDTVYLLRGSALITSLLEHDKSAHVFALTMDENSYQALTRLNYPRVTAIRLVDFETPDLLTVKSGRTKGEYCWTCTPHLIRYCIETYSLHSCTYVDADLFFYSSPQPLLDEVREKSILLTEHRYSQGHDQSASSGVYCVQFMYFKNDNVGRDALNWWSDRCIEWCFARHEDGKFGDQKYLDDWTDRFAGVHVLQHLGGALGPWNIQQYQLVQNEADLLHMPSNSKVSPIFYHFHDLSLYEDGSFDIGGYPISKNLITTLYYPLLARLQKIEQQFKNHDIQSKDRKKTPAKSLLFPLRFLKNIVKPRFYKSPAPRLP